MIRFTQHARRRMTERGVSESLEVLALEDPDEVERENGTIRSLKRFAQGLLVVRLKERGGDDVVISVWWRP